MDDRAVARGELILQASANSSLCLLNTDSSTRLPIRGAPSSPDLTFCSAHLALAAVWQPATRLNSDHLPILINIHDTDPSPPDLPPRLNNNYRKADWDAFGGFVEGKLAMMSEPGSCSQGEKILRAILSEASSLFIPRGRTRDFIPNLPREAKTLISTRDQLRNADPAHPDIPELNLRITRALDASRREAWERTVMQAGPNDPSTKFWSLLRELSGKKANTPANMPITFGEKTYTSKPSIAGAFCRLYTGRAPPRDGHHRQLKREIRRRSLDHDLRPFSPQSVQNAIRESGSSTALGPDNLNIHHLRHLGPTALEYLSHLYNLSIAHADIPAIWRQAIIIAIPKPGKPSSLGSSYRPISLLSPLVKVLERLLLPSLQTGFSLAESQHGFRAARSTTTALLPITESIARGFNKRKPPTRTTVMALDFSKAFDTVPHDRLLLRVLQADLSNNMVRWVAAYLGGGRPAASTSRCAPASAGPEWVSPRGPSSRRPFSIFSSPIALTLQTFTHLMRTISRRRLPPRRCRKRLSASLGTPRTLPGGLRREASLSLWLSRT